MTINSVEFITRLGVPGDAAMLADLGRRAFSETFAKDNTPEDMAAYLAENFSIDRQAEELARPGSLFVILEQGGNPVGYARLQDGAAETCITGIQPMELVRFYLLQAWTGHRLGDRLMQACLDHARGRGVDVLWLGVWDQNSRAIAFYKRWGFKQVGAHTFRLGQDQQTDFIMARRLE